jgi:serine/threonine protein kinase
MTDLNQYNENHLSNMMKLDNKNLRKILGIRKENNYFGIVYKYYDYNLYSFARNCDYSFEDRRKVALGIISGLMYLHSKKIIVKNLKPSNILISNGEAVISDWELPIRNNISGFTAPENNEEVTRDIFSLAWVLVLLFLQVDVGSQVQFDGLFGLSQVPGL